APPPRPRPKTSSSTAAPRPDGTPCPPPSGPRSTPRSAAPASTPPIPACSISSASAAPSKICPATSASTPAAWSSPPRRVVVQWDKDDCADLGIIKVDLLGLGMMAALQDALRLLHPQAPAAAPETLDLAQLPPDDHEVYRMLQAADTIGLFQVESRAQMSTLPRMRPANVYDLVVEVG